MTEQPPDLMVEYEWCEGTIPPPDYYEYTIRIGPGPHGVVLFRPDYPSHDPPEWAVPFDVTADELSALWAELAAAGLLSGRSWPAREDHAVGGSLERVTVAQAGRPVTVPWRPAEPERLAPLYRFLRSLVPEPLWRDLRARHEAYGRTS
ncbi:MAG: hypothetical protein JXQ27_06595 [Acidobacteria bacterium]|nr:hypothetical protein [Acidobacteriota bacterium]